MRALLLLIPALLIGCQSGPDLDRAARAADIANHIAQSPEDAYRILAAARVDPVEYQKWLYEIAEDPVESRAYLDALEVPAENPYTPDGLTVPRPNAGRPPGIGEASP